MALSVQLCDKQTPMAWNLRNSYIRTEHKLIKTQYILSIVPRSFLCSLGMGYSVKTKHSFCLEWWTTRLISTKTATSKFGAWQLTCLGACPAYIATEFNVCGRHKEWHFSRKRIDRPVPTAASLLGLLRRNLMVGSTIAATIAVRVGAHFSASLANVLHLNLRRSSTDITCKRDVLAHNRALSFCTNFVTSWSHQLLQLLWVQREQAC